MIDDLHAALNRIKTYVTEDVICVSREFYCQSTQDQDGESLPAITSAEGRHAWASLADASTQLLRCQLAIITQMPARKYSPGSSPGQYKMAQLQILAS